MLDKQLCAIFSIDEFSQWIMKELDYIEDQLYASDISSPRYIELRAIHSTLKDVRDAYSQINKKEFKGKERKVNNQIKPTYRFEITIIDRENNPLRFNVLAHHFDYLCPLDQYPEVTIYGVGVTGYSGKVIITGYADGENASRLLSAADLTDWGDATIVSLNPFREKDTKIV